MFLTTGGINRTYAIKGIVNATTKKTLLADEIDKVDQYDDLYEIIKEQLTKKAVALQGDAIIEVRFVPEIVRVAVGPKYMLLHGYGTVINFIRKH
ncbi:hypothetical protein LB941_05445 [Ligilactobacillus sp. WILCCON 0076]|uniref:Uncharacterized protein n=1 Tax=Ligilactobacillus ubinensis TaxID=2876789 RepID=A0A9X2JL92_9LACO|nr:hypothetical protein [Ligilactobacillus ubinensis]MCP0886782.1 hypothetical protein [Ligilactobacillus ubinensis]